MVGTVCKVSPLSKFTRVVFPAASSPRMVSETCLSDLNTESRELSLSYTKESLFPILFRRVNKQKSNNVSFSKNKNFLKINKDNLIFKHT
ncbi:hypothetical protein EHP00_1045 [Ecytonucleospora hepatopenaei]|uniref:Uncharacterized protein n=1 Tax=Ecytonucleospora hepatopenaei TaxID=646526 RepID=A0A1W0E5G7_9MICR|nr:hypothetical protein EHP00_1045 [Ecytonucleospora hepatopenaei]